jgi:aryl-alcohol dehydrogenase-like predicted oxidoreductase
MARYNSDQSREATEAYAAIAAKHNLTLTQLSLAFVTDRPFVTSNIIGATTMAQLQENIATADISPFTRNFKRNRCGAWPHTQSCALKQMRHQILNGC